MKTKLENIYDIARFCPKCEYDLGGSIHAPITQCPECGLRFSKRDLFILNCRRDPKGEPASFSPHECRINGRWLIWSVIILFMGIVIYVLMMIFSGHPTF